MREKKFTHFKDDGAIMDYMVLFLRVCVFFIESYRDLDDYLSIISKPMNLALVNDNLNAGFCIY